MADIKNVIHFTVTLVVLTKIVHHVMIPTLPLLVTPEVVIVRTYGATSADKVGIMITLLSMGSLLYTMLYITRDSPEPCGSLEWISKRHP